jgi:hypothetical protein
MDGLVELHKDTPGPFYRPYWGEPRYLNDGDMVWLPSDPHPTNDLSRTKSDLKGADYLKDLS